MKQPIATAQKITSIALYFITVLCFALDLYVIGAHFMFLTAVSLGITFKYLTKYIHL
jgi:hypothetical protein